MTVTDVCITNYNPSLSAATGRAYSPTYRATYTGSFDPKAVINGTITGLPKIGIAATWDTDCYCNGVSGIELSESKTFFTLTASFAQNIWIDTKDKVDFEQCEEEREVFFDVDEKPIINSANQIFDNQPTTNRGVDSFFVTGLRTSLHIPDASDWTLVNSAPITIKGKTFGTGTVAYFGCSTTDVKIDGGYEFIQHRWAFRVRKSHDLKVPDMGTVDVDGNRIKIKGRYVENPYPLNGSGKPLTTGFDPETDIVKLEFDITEDLDFGVFAFIF